MSQIPIHNPNEVTSPMRSTCRCVGDSPVDRETDGTITCLRCKGTVDYREAPDELKTCSRCGRSAAFRYDDYEQGYVSTCCTWPAKRCDPPEVTV